MYLRAIPVDAPPVFEVLDEVWRRAGYRLTDTTGPDGRLLAAHDRLGYTLALHQHRGDPLLVASSPPIGRGPGVPTGWCVGLVVGVLAALVPVDVPVVRRWIDTVRASALPSGWPRIPACLDRPAILAVLGLAVVVMAIWRRFGVGLLLGAASAGLVVGLVCAAPGR